MSNAAVFARITKVDEAKRLVFGRATQSVVDASGEIFDYETSKPHFEKWSQDVQKDSGGKSLGNVRSMHSNVAAGKLEQLLFIDDEQAIDVAAKVVDDAEWGKVLEGVYTGFSIGGRYVKKWKDKDDNAVTRYTAKPSEISLVDRPACPTATFFEIQKVDGTTMQKGFKLSDEELAKKAKEQRDEAIAYLVTKGKFKAEDFKDISDTDVLENYAELKKAIEQATSDLDAANKADGNEEETVDVQVPGSAEDVQALGKTLTDAKLTIKEANEIVQKAIADRAEAAKKAEEREALVGQIAKDIAENLKVETLDPATDLGKSIMQQANVAVSLQEHTHDWPAVVKVDGDKTLVMPYAEFRKGLMQCGSFAYMLDSLFRLAENCMVEQEMEGDDSDICQRMKQACYSLGEVLRDMVAEEISEELIGGKAEAGHHSGPTFAYAAQVDDLMKCLEGCGVEKGSMKVPVGFAKKLQNIHDLCAKCGIKCDMGKDLSAEELQKAGVDMKPEQYQHLHEIHKLASALGAACADKDDEDAEKLGKMLPDQLQKMMNDAIAAATAPLKAQLEELGKRAGPSTVTLRVVGKGGDVTDLNKKDSGQNVAPVKTGAGDAVNESATAIKKVHQTGGESFFKTR